MSRFKSVLQRFLSLTKRKKSTLLFRYGIQSSCKKIGEYNQEIPQSERQTKGTARKSIGTQTTTRQHKHNNSKATRSLGADPGGGGWVGVMVQTF